MEVEEDTTVKKGSSPVKKTPAKKRTTNTKKGVPTMKKREVQGLLLRAKVTEEAAGKKVCIVTVAISMHTPYI